VPDDLAAAAGEVRLELLEQAADRGRPVVARAFVQLVRLGKVVGRLDVSEHALEAVAPALQQVARGALHVPQRLPALPRRLRVDEVGQRLHLRQVQLAILKGAPRELAGRGQPQARQGGEGLQHVGDHGRPAVHVQLGHILAGEAVRPGKGQHQRAVQPLLRGRVVQRPQRRLPRRRPGGVNGPGQRSERLW